MISKTQLEKLSQHFKIDTFTILREYIQIAFLNHFYREKESEKIYFKGGTCMHLCYNSPRFSEDLDFSTVLSEQKIKKLLNKTIKNLELEIGEISLKLLYKGQHSIRFKIKHQSEFSKYPLTIKLDFAFEKIFLEPNILSLKTKFPTTFFSLIACEKEEEILEEKIRAFLIRDKGRDIFDLWYLLDKGVLIDQKLLEKKLKAVNIKFDRNLFIKKIKNYPERKIYLDLSKFLPENYRKIISDLKKRLIYLLEKEIQDGNKQH